MSIIILLKQIKHPSDSKKTRGQYQLITEQLLIAGYLHKPANINDDIYCLNRYSIYIFKCTLRTNIVNKCPVLPVRSDSWQREQK